MSIHFLNSVNLNNNELQNFKLQSLAVAPANPGEGQLYFNTAENKAKVFENGQWRNLTVEEAKSWQTEIDGAKEEAIRDANAYTDEKIRDFQPVEVNYNQKLADVLRVQDPTINRLLKDLARLSDDEKRQITNPVKEELETKITAVKDELLGGASEDLDTLKELGEAVKRSGNIAEVVKNLPKKEVFTLGNVTNGQYTVTHTRNTEDVIVAVYNPNKQQVLTDVQVINSSTIRVIVAAGTNLTGYKVVVIG